MVQFPSLWPVTTANSYLVMYLVMTVVMPVLYGLWWYRRDLFRLALAFNDAVGLQAIKLYRKVTR